MTIGGRNVEGSYCWSFLESLKYKRTRNTFTPPPPNPSLTACLAIISLLQPWNLPTFSNGLPIPVHTSEKRDYFWVSCSRWTHNQSQSLHLHLSIEKCLHSRQVAHPAGAHQCLTSPRMDEITAPPTSMRVKHLAQECKTMTQSSCKPRVQGQVVQS